MADDATTAARRGRGRRGRRSPGSCSRRSSSSSTGRCSGSRSGRAGRRRQMRSPLRARRRRPRRSSPATATRPHDAALPFAWSTAATIEPWSRARTSSRGSSPTSRRRESSVHILMFGWREGEVGMEMAALLRAQARGGRRGAGDRRQLRLAAVRGGARDVHRARRGGCADRRQRRLPARPRRPLPRRPEHRLAPGRGRPSRPPQALRDRRRRRLDRRGGDRGPLRERRLPRRDGARHRRRRPAGAGGVPDELPRPRRPAARPTSPRTSPRPPTPARPRSRSRR